MNLLNTLNDKLLRQEFAGTEPDVLEDALRTALTYSVTENSVSVLSDLKAARSYIFKGGAADGLGLSGEDGAQEIDSIWEEELFARIHPDDLVDKYKLELHFFNLLKGIAVERRPRYHITGRMRMRCASGQYRDVFHRMFYLASSANGSLWLALCLYNFTYDRGFSGTYGGMIVDSATGEVSVGEVNPEGILSAREREVLLLIRQGKLSKEIAATLCISKNTVSRHRQNILDKLRVKNSIEACRLAELLKLI